MMFLTSSNIYEFILDIKSKASSDIWAFMHYYK
jgi:hypothetical protein